MRGYKVAEVQSEFYYCCTKNSLIGLSPKYIKNAKVIKSENIWREEIFPKRGRCKVFTYMQSRLTCSLGHDVEVDMNNRQKNTSFDNV